MMGFVWSMCRNLNTWGVFLMNQVQMRSRKDAGAIRFLVNARGLKVECVRCFMRPSSCLFCCKVVRQ